MKTLLLVVDGMGLPDDAQRSAVTAASMPFLFHLMDKYGHCALGASGTEVGLGEGQSGNSEIGHLTIGAGRRIPSTLESVNLAYENGSWQSNPIWKELGRLEHLHILGLVSDAGVHGHLRTLWQAAILASQAGAENIHIHALLDGVDSQAKSAPRLLSILQERIRARPNIRLATAMGRKWACDRSGNLDVSRYLMERLAGKHPCPEFTEAALEKHLETSGESEFPCHVFPEGRYIGAGETVLFSNTRADRTTQLAQVFAEAYPAYSVVELKDFIPKERVFFPTIPLQGGIAEALIANGIRSLRIAEKCKFPHVTFFMNGFRPSLGEDSLCIPSIPEAEIRNQPRMSLAEIVTALTRAIEEGKYPFVIANIANLDQVGHLGDLPLARKAAGFVDGALRHLADACARHGWNLVITSDHGNADVMLDETGKPFGSHSPNDVPLILVPAGEEPVVLRRTRSTLASVAPTVLDLAGLPIPSDMEPSLLANPIPVSTHLQTK
jgi:2,3-bisphosphoglycerate-independent phosphoglycerate mutase